MQAGAFCGSEYTAFRAQLVAHPDIESAAILLRQRVGLPRDDKASYDQWLKTIIATVADAIDAEASPPVKGAIVQTATHSVSPSGEPFNGWASARDVASHFSVPDAKFDAMEKRLVRLRQTYSGDANLWRETEAAGPRQARYLYNVADARVRDAAAGETSSERPPK
jgi:hypothetical protein